MADYPTPSDYQEALQVPDVAFADPELQSATPRTNALGLPQPLTGSFAAVFPVTTDGGVRYAVKCFLTDVPEQRRRYQAVAEALDAIDRDAFVAFEYQPEGIRVKETSYPLLKMEWAEGTTLNQFVESHLDQPGVLDHLAETWADLMADLEAMDLAHGDLQHGNVLVAWTDDSLRLRLVDYDTMYVPALKGHSSAEVGHRNYQHPDRTDADFGPYLDRFAGIVIYVGLRASAVRPGLWERYNSGENLLFRDSDFYAPEDSPLFEELADIEPLRDLEAVLRTACYVEPADVPPLAAAREGRSELGRRAVSRVRSRRPRDTAVRTPFARAFLPATLVGALLAVGLAVAGWTLAALGVILAGGVLGAGMAVTRYRRLSIVRRRRRLKQEVERFTTAIRGLEREIDSLQEKREELLTSLESRREERLREVQEEALHDRLKHHFVGEVRDIEGLTHKHVVRLKAANIRTASEATPEALDAVRRISDQARARLKRWRAALEEKYADEIPDALSPAQKRRLQRYVEHRVEDIDAQLARTREKVETQAVERERVRDRLEEMPEMTFGHYVRYLFWIETLPTQTNGPPGPKISSERENQREEYTPVAKPIDDDRPWWTRNREG